MTETVLPGGAGAGIPVENPATGEVLASVPELGTADVHAMVTAARAAQPGWWDAGFDARAEILLKAREWLVANAERVISTICAETGRPAPSMVGHMLEAAPNQRPRLRGIPVSAR